ncbi:S9 family peptidase [Pedobacter africanus]|uniref:Dipeptidyl-peptidase IV Serine peptidase. MEROPS family S09B n=1 Tax=Pedobacter africanus TaxID=151894 RepID=A0A1W2AW31_9SPHI|nr:S9 family peptidase [Pedobacter africanus]SMC64418.1 dipeptidyl-peptidase IV Serine peptidase. MEROPS family S09B [Pedobacter africanus]
MKKLNIIALLSAGLYLTPCTSRAQQGTSDIDFVKRLPVFHWVDDNHYKTYRMNGMMRASDEVIVDVLTGKETITERTGPVKSRINITRNGLVIIARKNASGADTLKGLQTPVVSPDSSNIAYTKNRNLYVYNISEGKEWQVTADGSETVYNGWSSWVYNEEILGRGMAYRAFWWSPDSKKIAFMRFDDAKVPVYYMTDDTGIHQKQIAVRYPLAGDTNPEVKIGIAGLAGKTITWADYDAKADQYFGTPIWTPDAEQLWVQWMNRGQDTLKIEAIDLILGNRKPVYTETQKTWVSLDQDNRITFVPAKKMFLLMSDKDGWMHIYLHNMQGKQVRQLTSGKWTVTEINYIDEKAGQVYFTGKKENSTRTDLYVVKLTGGEVKRLTFGEFAHRFELSPNAKYFITTYSNFKTPGKVALLDTKGKMIRELADSRGKDYEKYVAIAPKSEIIRVRTADGFDLPVRISYPANFNPAKKYPVLASIYGGPNSVFVNDGYYSSYTGKADERELIGVQMDHRGSGHFGKAGQNYLHRNLGHWEIEDYSTVIKYLTKKYTFIDAERVGVSGFSYGGYISALALVKAPELFKVGLAGGSVTDWHLYDSAYTERYMDSPKENPEGYKSSSVFTYVKSLKGHLSLAQGTLDDNVHMRNTMKLVDALIEADKQFEVMFYPGAAHGWYYLPHKAKFYNNANDKFIKTYLLQKSN